MCGIIGYTGAANAVSEVIAGLRLLEYRGYDSAGIAALTEKHKNGEIASLPERDKLPLLMMSADGRIGKALRLVKDKAASETEGDRKLTVDIIAALRQLHRDTYRSCKHHALRPVRCRSTRPREDIFRDLRDCDTVCGR